MTHKIKMERARGLEPPTCSFVVNCSNSVELRPRKFGGRCRTRTRKRQKRDSFQDYCHNLFGIPSAKKKWWEVRQRFLFFALYWKLADTLRFERRTSVLETDVLPVETTRLNFGVSDGTWTRSIRFGRPLLSHLSFAHKKIKSLVHRERFELSQLEEAAILQTACRYQSATDAWIKLFV